MNFICQKQFKINGHENYNSFFSTVVRITIEDVLELQSVFKEYVGSIGQTISIYRTDSKTIIRYKKP